MSTYTGYSTCLQQVPALLNPQGVCVVVLDSSRSSSGRGSNNLKLSVAPDISRNGADAAHEISCTDHAPAAAAAAAGVGSGSGFEQSMEGVKLWLEQQGFRFIKDQQVRYPVMGGSELKVAHAGVWLQPGV